MRDRFEADDDDRYRRDDDLDDDGFDRYPRRRRRRRPRPHSGLGIGACILAIISAGFLFFTFVIGAIVERNGNLPDNDPRTTAVGCFLLTGGGFAVIGFILGIVGAFESRRNRLFAGLGLGFNGCIVLGIATICIIGLLA